MTAAKTATARRTLPFIVDGTSVRLIINILYHTFFCLAIAKDIFSLIILGIFGFGKNNYSEFVRHCILRKKKRVGVFRPRRLKFCLFYPCRRNGKRCFLFRNRGKVHKRNNIERSADLHSRFRSFSVRVKERNTSECRGDICSPCGKSQSVFFSERTAKRVSFYSLFRERTEKFGSFLRIRGIDYRDAAIFGTSTGHGKRQCRRIAETSRSLELSLIFASGSRTVSEHSPRSD